MPEGPIFRGFQPENCFREDFCADADNPPSTMQKHKKHNIFRVRTIIKSFGRGEIREFGNMKILFLAEGFFAFRHLRY
jgi:hypothetical protein